MQIEQSKWTTESGWETTLAAPNINKQKNLVLVFGGRYEISNKDRYNELATQYPNSDIVIASTAGEILGTEVFSNSIVSTAIHFEKTAYTIKEISYKNFANSYDMGKSLALDIDHNNLQHLLIISDGQLVNGSELTKGLNTYLPAHVSTTGGLAGDDDRFVKTLVGYNSPPTEGNIIAIGFYGNDFKIGYSSVGGWTSFGPQRIITKSSGNILYELDGQSALALYKKYLGPKAADLPSSALLFPLSISLPNKRALVRTVLSIDEQAQSMIFAGDVPQGAVARLMKANFGCLIDGASDAGINSLGMLTKNTLPQLTLLISCVGRKLVLDQHVEEEVESIANVLGANTAITGFYSYGEIAPFTGFLNCELHNQTMTVTIMSENP